ncbi:LOW QUALITY PROTEIN: hypothetical protein AAY473_016446 [Plecturocebus cupreus]
MLRINVIPPLFPITSFSLEPSVLSQHSSAIPAVGTAESAISGWSAWRVGSCNSVFRFQAILLPQPPGAGTQAPPRPANFLSLRGFTVWPGGLDLDLDPGAASQSAGITGVSHRARPNVVSVHLGMMAMVLQEAASSEQNSHESLLRTQC